MMKRFLLYLLNGYRIFLAGFLGGQCRFYPSCSQYAKIAIEKKGAGRGLWMSLVRLAKCHPFSSGGIDDVK